MVFSADRFGPGIKDLGQVICNRFFFTSMHPEDYRIKVVVPKILENIIFLKLTDMGTFPTNMSSKVKKL